jgi:aspartyl-tRNA(Asn)/glutamyl-tRNA(Gln) amidotransferase subunit B
VSATHPFEESRIVSSRTGTTWEPVIGIEVHCQLKTRSKLFCCCRNEFGARPNVHTCPVCTGQPGAMPVLNRRALALGVRAALALGANVAERSKFDRKNYFYCDLPKGYQISQYDQPFCRGGGLELESGKRVRLHRIHLEEDAGKAIHDQGATTLVDLNRAGVPLIEAVTEADLSSSREAHEYLTALKEVLQFAGASDCDMEKGSLRCDVNVSVRPAGEPWRTRVEIKNVNSFKNVKDAIEHEIRRQIEAYEAGDPARAVVQETRLYDATSATTRPMRSKEDAHDYRYFPEPDLPPVTIDAAFLEAERAALPALAAARRTRYRAELGLSAYDAGVLTESPAVSDFFEAVVRESHNAKAAANWVQNEVLRALGDPEIPGRSLAELHITAAGLAELIALTERGAISKTAGRTVLREMLKAGRSAGAVVHSLGLEQVSDGAQLEAWCRAALAGKEAAIADVRAGRLKALGALIGPVMKASGGKANPQVVQDLFLKIIREVP